LSKPLIIFDLDGTLFQSYLVWIEPIQRALAEMGLAVQNRDQLVSYFGDPPRVLLAKLAPQLPRIKFNKFFKLIRKYGNPRIATHGRLYEGIKEMLGELHSQGFPIALCTNGRKEYAEYVLELSGISEYFDVLLSAEKNESKTPAVMNLVKKYNNAMIVGDRRNDFEAARETGIPSIAVAYGFGGEEVKLADFVAEKPADILTHALRINVFNAIEEKLNQNQQSTTHVIGINGVDTSGKTVFAVAFEKYLKSRGYKTMLIHLDDFHNPREVRNKGTDPVQSYIDNAFNLELLVNEILKPVSQGQTVSKELTLLDLETDKFSNIQHYQIVKNTVVILEGVLLYREPLDEHFSIRVFLDVEFDEVLRRAGKRDEVRFGPELIKKYESRYIPVQKRYFAEFNPIERSDILIDNNDLKRPKIMP